MDRGHTVFNPALPKHDFEESVRIAQEEVDVNRPDVIVGSSRGGAVAMAVDRAGARLVLIAPAWQRFGGTASVPPGTSVLHCTTDDQVPFSDSEQLQGARLIPCGEGHRMIDPDALETLGHAVEGTLKSESLVREYIREHLLAERAEVEASLLSGVGDYIASRRYDDVMDSVFKRIAPNLVRHVMEQEINEDMAEFLDGAIEGRFEKRGGWSHEDPDPKDHGHPNDSADYVLGYTWGWNNADMWKGNELPVQARKEAVEAQIEEFEDQISEQMVIAALEEANERVNPVKLIKKAVGAIRSAVHEEGLTGGLKKGLPIAIGIIVGEALDNFIIPMAFFSMTGIPIPPLPIGVGEIINPVVISIVGADMDEEALADELGWYEREYGEASSLGPREVNELREYIRGLLTEDPMGFVHDLAAASEEFGEPGEMFFGGDPGKGGGKAIKRAFNANADHQWLSTLDTVHWADAYDIEPLIGQHKDELSTTITLPGEKFDPEVGNVGLWVKGRITLAANDMDQLYSGHHFEYGPGKSLGGTEEEYEHRKKSSGINKRPTTSKDYSRYGQLKRGDEFAEKMARNMPYVLDQSTWHKGIAGETNEALVDNWKPVGLVITGEHASIAEEFAEGEYEIVDLQGVMRKLFNLAIEMGVPLFDLDRNELWRPE